MKYIKMLGLAGMAAMALMAFGAGTASATKIYGPEHTHLPIGTEIKATLETETTASLASTSESPIVTCTESEVVGKTTTTGSLSETVKGDVTKLTFTGSCSVTVTEFGKLEIHHIAGTTNGTLTGSGFRVIVHSPFVGECTYGLGLGHDLGTLKGSLKTGETATMDINANVTEQEPKRFLCPDTTKWLAKYLVTTPDTLYVEEN